MPRLKRRQKTGSRRGRRAAARESFGELPSQRTEPSGDLWDFSTLIFGAKKIGKSSVCAQIPGAFFFPTEPGLKSLSVYQPMDADNNPKVIGDYGEFCHYVDLFCDGKHDFRVAVIDTADAFYDICSDRVLADLGLDSPSEEDWGAGWTAIFNHYKRPIQQLLNSPYGVVMLSHDKSRDIERWDGAAFEEWSCSLTGKAGRWTTGVVDLWAYFGYRDEERRIWVRGKQGLDAGCRMGEHFLSPSGDELRSIPMGKNPKEAYANLLAGFNNQIEPEVTSRRAGKGGRRRKRK